jgi:hypothetical protein
VSPWDLAVAALSPALTQELQYVRAQDHVNHSINRLLPLVYQCPGISSASSSAYLLGKCNIHTLVQNLHDHLDSLTPWPHKVVVDTATMAYISFPPRYSTAITFLVLSVHVLPQTSFASIDANALLQETQSCGGVWHIPKGRPAVFSPCISKTAALSSVERVLAVLPTFCMTH